MLRLADLPPGFQLAAEPVVDEDGYTVVYVRVAAVQESADAAGHLLGVTVNLRVHPDVPSATRRYDELTSRDAEAIAREIRETSGEVSDVSVVPIDANLTDTDAAAGFRVRYAIQGLPLFEYRYRFRTRNVVGNLSVSARGVDGTEPSLLRQEARGIANRQTRRVAEALP